MDIAPNLPPEGLLTLSLGERESLLWKKVAKEMTRKLDAARRRLEGSLDPQETERVRGQIKELRSLLALGEERPGTVPTGLDGWQG